MSTLPKPEGYVICQADHSPTGGCSYCGGCGYVLEQMGCQLCHRAGWFRPLRGITLYHGRVIRSVNGVDFVVHFDRPWNCERCEDAHG